ncbi:MAG: septum formation initiator family protein [Acidimicrobiia bacterium]
MPERRKPKPAAKPATKPKPKPKPKARAKANREAGRRRAVVSAAIGSVVLVGLLFAFVYPTRTFLDQRDDTNRARAQLELLKSESAKLARETKRLKSDAEIERRARGYGLVRPGEQPFVIIPAATTLPPAETANPAP